MKKLLLFTIPLLLSWNITNAQTALEFDGINDYVNIGNTSSLNFTNTNSFTIEAWIKTSNVSNPGMIYSKMFDAGPYTGYEILTNASGQIGVYLISDFGGSNFIYAQTNNSVFPTNTFTHIAVSYDGSSNANGLNIYVNGNITPFTATQNNLTGNIQTIAPAQIGARNGGRNLNATLDDVRVWNTVRTQTQIRGKMNACLKGNETGLVAFYNFEDGTGSATLTDLTANGNDGTLSIGMDPATDWVAGINSCISQVCSIVDQTVSGNTTMVCSGSADINVASSEVGVNYYLRDNANDSVVAGPTAGTGNAIDFNTGNIDATTTYNVYGAKTTSTGLGLDFDGLNDRVIIPSLTDLSGSAITIEYWFKGFDTQSAVRYQNPFTGNYVVAGWLNQHILSNDGGTANGLPQGAAAEDGNWHHLAMTWEQNTVNGFKTYLDGNLVAQRNSSNIPIPNQAYPLILGSQGGTSEFMRGTLDEVKIWNVARSQAELQASMNSCLTGSEPGLVAYYDFEDGTGSTILTDLSSNGNDGNLTNMDATTDWVAGNISCTSCELEMSTTATVTINPIADQTVSGDTTMVCSGNTDINVASSETGVNYYLRDNSNDSVIAGPVAGTGSGLSLNTGIVSSTTSYNVYGTNESKALIFDGVDDYLVSAGTPLSATSGSWEAWVKKDDWSVAGSNDDRLLDNGINFGTDNAFYISLHPAVGFHFRYGGTGQVGNMFANNTSVYGFTAGSKHHLAATWNNIAGTTTISIYIDGVLANSSSSALVITPSADCFIGTRGTANFFGPGTMDEVVIWNVERSAAEIAASVSACYTGNESNMEAYYSMDEGVGAVASDMTSNGYDLTLNGMNTVTAWVNGLDTCTSCSLEMSTIATVTINPIADQTVTATIDTITCAGDSTTIDVASSQIGVNYYLFNDGDSTLIDGPVVGDGNSLLLNTYGVDSTTTYHVYATNESYALDFDGVDDKVLVNGIDLANKSFTIETWLKRKSIGTYDIIAGQGSLSNNNGLHIGFRDNNTFTLAFYNNDLNTAATYTSTDWHHWAATYDAVTNIQKVYRDGVLVGSRVASVDYSGTGVFNIGSASWGNSSDMLMDDYRIWDHARTQSDITINMNNCLSGIENGLIALYDFNDGRGSTTLSDLTSSSNNGTLTNMDVSASWVQGLANCATCNLEMTQKATVYIETPGMFTQDPSNQSACDGGDAYFLIDGSGAVDGLDWQVSTDNGSTWNNITLGSGIYSGAEDSLHLSGVSVTEDGYMYRSVATKCGNYVDSTTAATFTINDATTGTDVIFACGSYIWNGINYTSDNNTAKDTLINANGCDSIVTLDLTIGTFSQGNITVNECDSVVLFGQTITSDTVISDTILLGSAQGCDTITVATVSILNSVTANQTIEECDEATINGNVYTTSQIVTDVLANQAANGCDSVVVTDLTINMSSSSTIDTTLNEGESITVGSNTYNVEGTYTDTLQNASGCDSVITTNLTITDLPVDGINGINNGFVNVYPNPTKGLVTVKSENVLITNVSIVDMQGREQLMINNVNAIEKQVNVTSLADGIYFMKVKSTDGNQSIIRITKLK